MTATKPQRSQAISTHERVTRLRTFIETHRRMPGYNEMFGLFGYRSKNAIHRFILKLHDLGYVVKEQGGKFSPTDKLMGRVRLLGTVQAGFPSPAEEELIDTLSLDSFLIERPEATFMLTVTGDSMIDAGIQPGDMVLVEKGKEPRGGDIVVAQVDGEWTMKYFTRDRQGIRLDPANRNYKPIRPKNDLELAGVVRSVIRKYS